MIAAIVSGALARANARLPETISYRIDPNANWSERKSSASPRACSGDMYPTVPSTTPTSVPAEAVGDCVSSPLSPVGAVSFASPKSRILAVPSFVTITFSGFRSRCTIPVSWALASPSAICVATASSFFSGSGPAASSLRKVSPSTRSMAIHDVPSAEPMS